jgi:hypothetical protein
MALSFKFYRDAELTLEVTTALSCSQEVDGSSDAVVHCLYFGSVENNKKLVSDVAPNQIHIELSVVDDQVDTGHPATDITLASTEAGLITATPGASLDFGTNLLSGVDNAQPVWIKFDDSTYVSAASTELRLQTNTVKEVYI